jgi:hypothetical protein
MKAKWLSLAFPYTRDSNRFFRRSHKVVAKPSGLSHFRQGSFYYPEAYKHRALNVAGSKAPRGRQIVGRVDVENRAWVRSRDFDARLGGQGSDEPARALVAFKAHRRFEQPPAEKNRVAAPAFMGGDGRERVLALKKSVDQGVNEPGFDPGHVAKKRQRALDVAGHGGETDPQRRGEAAREFRIEGKLDAEIRERRLDRTPRIAGDGDDGTRLGRERRFRDPSDDRLAIEFRHELRRVRTAASAKPGRSARSKQDGADPIQASVVSLRFTGWQSNS